MDELHQGVKYVNITKLSFFAVVIFCLFNCRKISD